MTPSRNGDSRNDGGAGGVRDVSTVWYEDSGSEALVRAELSEPDTDDYRLVTDCLVGEASPEDRQLYEARKRNEPQFRELAEWLELIWEQHRRLVPEPSRAALMEAERTMEKFWRRVDLEERGMGAQKR